MNTQFTLTLIEIKKSIYRVDYIYDYPKELNKYFNKKDPFYVIYDIPINDIPDDILVIPFVANFAPISWFVGFDIKVNDIDSIFYHSLKEIKTVFSQDYKELVHSKSEIYYNKLTSSQFKKNKSAMLFSGGVDAYTTFFRHYDEQLDLVTVKGADIDITDYAQWDSLIQYNSTTPILTKHNKHYIESNLRTFYTKEINFLLPTMGWWGYIQHGLALITLLAPLSYTNGYNTIYIASSRSTFSKSTIWGSVPKIDEKISWAQLNVIHDGFELKRQNKIDYIVSTTKKLKINTPLRVCYSELNSSLNCCLCEKCYRTIFGVILSGDNPNHYGFNVDISIYDRIQKTIKNGFRTHGVQTFWLELLEKSKVSKPFYFFNIEQEDLKIKEIITLLEYYCNKEIITAPSRLTKIKTKIINRFPNLFNFYLKYKRKIS